MGAVRAILRMIGVSLPKLAVRRSRSPGAATVGTIQVEVCRPLPRRAIFAQPPRPADDLVNNLIESVLWRRVRVGGDRAARGDHVPACCPVMPGSGNLAGMQLTSSGRTAPELGQLRALDSSFYLCTRSGGVDQRDGVRAGGGPCGAGSDQAVVMRRMTQRPPHVRAANVASNTESRSARGSDCVCRSLMPGHRRDCGRDGQRRSPGSRRSGGAIWYAPGPMARDELCVSNR